MLMTTATFILCLYFNYCIEIKNVSKKSVTKVYGQCKWGPKHKSDYSKNNDWAKCWLSTASDLDRVRACCTLTAGSAPATLLLTLCSAFLICFTATQLTESKNRCCSLFLPRRHFPSLSFTLSFYQSVPKCARLCVPFYTGCHTGSTKPSGDGYCAVSAALFSITTTWDSQGTDCKEESIWESLRLIMLHPTLLSHWQNGGGAAR